jgi:hypothetical protein
MTGPVNASRMMTEANEQRLGEYPRRTSRTRLARTAEHKANEAMQRTSDCLTNAHPCCPARHGKFRAEPSAASPKNNATKANVRLRRRRMVVHRVIGPNGVHPRKPPAYPAKAEEA